jgi:hypothetical protein
VVDVAAAFTVVIVGEVTADDREDWEVASFVMAAAGLVAPGRSRDVMSNFLG